MAKAKRATKRTTRRAAALALGAAGVSLTMTGGASATAPTNVPLRDDARRIFLGEEEIADVSLATFHVFDRETEVSAAPRFKTCGGRWRVRYNARLRPRRLRRRFLRGCGWRCASWRWCGWWLCSCRWRCGRRLRRSWWRLRWSWWWLCGSYGRLRWSWWWLCWSWLQRLRGSWQRFRRLRLGRCVVRNCLLGQHRLHWKLLAMGPIPRSMDQRLLLMSLAPTIFDAEQWWCQVPIAGEHHCSKND